VSAEPFAGPGRQQPEPAGKPVEQMTFEEALAELETIVQRLERGQLDLDASIAAYERGTLLRQHCADKLRQAQLRVEKLTLDREGGGAKLQPFDGGQS
jgi:exodeoxyribonuclease VII small subunit